MFRHIEHVPCIRENSGELAGGVYGASGETLALLPLLCVLGLVTLR